MPRSTTGPTAAAWRFATERISFAVGMDEKSLSGSVRSIGGEGGWAREGAAGSCFSSKAAKWPGMVAVGTELRGRARWRRLLTMAFFGGAAILVAINSAGADSEVVGGEEIRKIESLPSLLLGFFSNCFPCSLAGETKIQSLMQNGRPCVYIYRTERGWGERDSQYWHGFFWGVGICGNLSVRW